MTTNEALRACLFRLKKARRRGRTLERRLEMLTQAAYFLGRATGPVGEGVSCPSLGRVGALYGEYHDQLMHDLKTRNGGPCDDLSCGPCFDRFG